MVVIKQKIPMTSKGASALREELYRLKTKERPSIINQIAEAREQGDLKENAEYHSARERQSFVEGRINDIEAKLSNSQIIDVSTLENEGKVVFGATVTLINMDNQQEVTYKIVGDDEADLKIGKISVNSPIARALIGKYESDEVEVKTPSGMINYEISFVKYI